MGTRGTHGVRLNGVDKLTYNQYDTYPDGLGITVLEELRAMLEGPGVDWIKAKAEALRMVPQDGTPTLEEVALYSGETDPGVSTGTDWYATLRHLQGQLYKPLKLGIMTDADGFIRDSLFCEWGYIVNLDDSVLEVYEGFQSKPHQRGRYALQAGEEPKTSAGGTYYPCALIATFPFAALPTAEEFVAAVKRATHRADEDEQVGA